MYECVSACGSVQVTVAGKKHKEQDGHWGVRARSTFAP